MDVTVRALGPDDAASFRAIRLEALEQNPEAFQSTFEAESGQALDFFRDRLGRGAVFGAFRGGALVGTAGFYALPGEKQRHKGVLWGMYVQPGARGSGAAPLLVEAVKEHARSRVELLHLTVVSSNARARRLYERMGFTAYGVEERGLKLGARYFDEVLMVCFMSPPSA